MKQMNKKIRFTATVIIEPDEGEYHAFCPALKGLHVGGRTVKEALSNAQDAVVAYITSLIKHGEPIPCTVFSKAEVFEDIKHGNRFTVKEADVRIPALAFA